MNEKLENMMHEYRAAFIALGFDTYNKDIIEVLTFLVNELNKTKGELYDLKVDMYSKIDKIERTNQ